MDIIKPHHREELTLLSIISTNICIVIAAFGSYIFRSNIEAKYSVENPIYFVYTLLFFSLWLTIVILMGWIGYGSKKFVQGITARSPLLAIITIVLAVIYYIFIARNLFGVTVLCQEDLMMVGKMCAILTMLVMLLVGILLFSQIFAILYYALSLIGMVGRIVIAALDFVLTHWAFCGICLGFFLMAGGSLAYFNGLEKYAPLPIIGLILVIVIALAKWADELYFIIELLKKLWLPILILIIIFLVIKYFGIGIGLCFELNKVICSV